MNTDIYLKVFGKEIELTDDVRNLKDLKERMVMVIVILAANLENK